MKSIIYILGILCFCSCSYYKHEQLMFRTEIGMSKKKFIKEVYRIEFEKNLKYHYFDIDSVKYEAVRILINNGNFANSSPDPSGFTAGHVSNYSKSDAFYYIFVSDTLLDIGYIFEFKREEDKLHQKIGAELAAIRKKEKEDE